MLSPCLKALSSVLEVFLTSFTIFSLIFLSSYDFTLFNIHCEELLEVFHTYLSYRFLLLHKLPLLVFILLVF